MQILGLSPALTATRAAIAHSIARYTADTGAAIERAANALIARWKDYEQAARGLAYPCGLLTWFGECRWKRPAPSPRHGRPDASIGMERAPAPALDLEALQAKTRALIDAAELEDDEPDDDEPERETAGQAIRRIHLQQLAAAPRGNA
jgi:hypothetical protein